LEKIVLDGPGGAVVSDQVTWPWTSVTATTADQEWDAPLTAMLTGTAETDTYTTLASGETRQTQSISTYNTSNGLLLQVNDLNDLSQTSQAVCTTYAYPSPPSSAGLLDYPAEVQSVAGACPNGPPALVPDSDSALLSDTKYSYDGQANGVAPVSGNITETQVYASADSSNHSPHWVTQSVGTFDSYGRLTSDENEQGYTTTTSFSSSYGTGYATTSQTVTGPLSCTTNPVTCANANTTTAINPEWGTTATYTDPDNEVTTYQYDPLGRVTAVWLPAEPTSGLASYKYAYSLSGTVVTSQQLVNSAGGDYSTTVTLYDSLLRPRQTQTSSDYSGGGSIVTDTYYDSRGNTVITDGPYWESVAPTGSLFSPGTGESDIPDETVSSYDGAGRITESDQYSDGSKQWGTSWVYNGSDEVTETPPAGGTITTTFTDALGRTAAIDQYQSATSASGPYDATTYTYNPAGQLASVTDPGDDQWTWTYNLAGQPVSESDPDTGVTNINYDDLGQVTTVTDGAGDNTSYSYDAAGRTIGEYASEYSSQNSSNQLAAWTYDASAMTGGGTKHAYGLLASTSSYVGGTGGETYTETINSYDQADHQTSVTWTIPQNAVTGALGGSTTGGNQSYAFGYTYNADGSLASQSFPQAGGLDGETESFDYDDLGFPSVTGGSPYDDDYVTETAYSPLNQLSALDLGTAETYQPWTQVDYDYNPVTGALGQMTLSRQSNDWAADSDVSYAYNNDGSLISADDSATDNNQCYVYDSLSRLTAAWSQGTPCPADPTTAPAASGIGGPAPYEQTTTYDDQGTGNDGTTESISDITGTTLITGTSPAQTTTATTYGYPYYGSAQPHTPVQESTSVNGGTATVDDLTWTGQQPGYLTGIASAGGTSVASYDWDGAKAVPGQLYWATTGSGKNTVTTNYRYDADGNLLIVADGSVSTLYLPGEELTANGSAVTATRYYTVGSQVIAARNPAGLSWLIPNQQGTALAEVGTANQNLTARYYTPYGDLLYVIGTGTWPGTKGFLGGTSDTTTGLTNLGAREFSPALPAFISPDPLMSPYTPADLNPYSYAYNNPATQDDPTGQTVNTYQACGSDDPYCGTGALPSQPEGGWGDLFGGVINGGYDLLADGIDSTVLMYGGPPAVKAINSILPPQIPVGDPDSTLYGAGDLAATLLPAAFGDEASDAGELADLGLDAKSLSTAAEPGAGAPSLLERLQAGVENADVSTDPDKAMFYSGPGNRARALSYASEHGLQPIDLTPGGQWLESENAYDSLPTDEADALWARLSERYAEQASGEVNIFVRGANPQRIWATVEQPTIYYFNPEVYLYRFHY
jgi:RHS repeat-associated protein